MDNAKDPSASGSSPFESIRKVNEEGFEYWSARDLAKILGYTEYGKFTNPIQKAEAACENSGQKISDHFAHVSEMVSIGSIANPKRKYSAVTAKRAKATQGSSPAFDI